MMKFVVCTVLTLCLLPGLMTGQTKPAQDMWEPLRWKAWCFEDESRISFCTQQQISRGPKSQ
jgi:hypothetical protein